MLETNELNETLFFWKEKYFGIIGIKDRYNCWIPPTFNYLKWYLSIQFSDIYLSNPRTFRNHKNNLDTRVAFI